ncbi:MAG TPA: hypothetical protein VFF74_13005 [Methylophilaceae bacterium]|nr:hypothetical protein [Methylophilaceae bacterium]
MGKWGSRYLNAITLSTHAGLLLAAVFAFNSVNRHQSWLVFAAISLVMSLLTWHFNFRRLLAIAEHPTSTIAAAAQGYVELLGRAKSLLPLKSPLQGEPCVWFRHWVYAKDQNNVWRLEHYVASEQNFEIEDATGCCLVNPAGAEVIAAERHVVEQNDHKYIEEVLYSGKPIYVLGELETITEAASAQQIRQEVGHLLADWKKSPALFKHRFDLDGNGEVDMHEWEMARAQASIEVLDKKGILNKAEAHLIRAPGNGQLFLISGIAPEELRARYRFWTRLHLLFAILAVLLMLLISYGHPLRAL